MAPIDAARGAAGAHTALGLILMLLTQLLSASPLAVPQLTYSTTSTRRDSITQAGAFSGRPNSNQNTNNNNHHHPHQQQPQLIKKITNWSEKPPDTYNSKPDIVQIQKQTKDLLIPLKSHFENLIKRNNSSNSFDPNHISRRSRNLASTINNSGKSSNNNNSTENLNVYFEKSFVPINQTIESNLVSETSGNDNFDSNNSEQSYSNPIRLHSDTGSAYFNDASILEAKKYNELLQHYKNDKSTNNHKNQGFSHEMYQILSTTNNQHQHNFINSQTEFNQKISHDFSSKFGKYICLSYLWHLGIKNELKNN